MLTGIKVEVDFIEELRLRRWARENYVPRQQRRRDWHPVVHDEMTRKDGEFSEADAPFSVPAR